MDDRFRTPASVCKASDGRSALTLSLNSDKQVIGLMLSDLNEYFANNHPNLDITESKMRQMTRGTFLLMFSELIKPMCLDDTQVYNIETDVPLLLRELEYPETVKKSTLQTLGAPTSFPLIIKLLYWLLEELRKSSTAADNVLQNMENNLGNSFFDDFKYYMAGENDSMNFLPEDAEKKMLEKRLNDLNEMIRKLEEKKCVYEERKESAKLVEINLNELSVKREQLINAILQCREHHDNAIVEFHRMEEEKEELRNECALIEQDRDRLNLQLSEKKLYLENDHEKYASLQKDFAALRELEVIKKNLDEAFEKGCLLRAKTHLTEMKVENTVFEIFKFLEDVSSRKSINAVLDIVQRICNVPNDLPLTNDRLIDMVELISTIPSELERANDEVQDQLTQKQNELRELQAEYDELLKKIHEAEASLKLTTKRHKKDMENQIQINRELEMRITELRNQNWPQNREIWRNKKEQAKKELYQFCLSGTEQLRQMDRQLNALKQFYVNAVQMIDIVYLKYKSLLAGNFRQSSRNSDRFINPAGND